MENNWVDFKAVKAAVSITMVLDHYGVNWLRKEKGELVGRCPIHKGEGSRTFHANPEKNAFNCFSCKAKGNVLDFVAAMEQVGVREAALRITSWFSISVPNSEPQNTAAKKTADSLPPKREEGGGTNTPLSFQLKGIDSEHSYLKERGIDVETAKRFGVGMFNGKGSMAGRIVFPIHNQSGELVAYAGRSIDGSEPRYKLPPGFHKSHELFNQHQVSGGVVVVVEGFFDCMKVWQSCNRNVVALMGCSLSVEQEHFLAKSFSQVRLMLDGDDAGRAAASEMVVRLARRVSVRIIDVGDGKQPDQLSREELSALPW
jgi:DNA primase